MKQYSDWIQAAGAIGILIGIALVILELRQNEELTRMQIATDIRANRDADRNVTRGETYSTTLARLQLAPESLTDAEVVEFSAHAGSLVNELFLRRQLNEVGVFIGGWRGFLTRETCELLDNPLGERWLAQFESVGDEEIAEELRQRTEACGPTFLQLVRDTSDGEAMADAVRAREIAFAQSMADRDLQAFAEFIAPEAIFFNGNDALRGRDAVVEAWAPFFEATEAPFSWRPDVVEVLDSGRLAISSGPVNRADGEAVGRFNSVWRRGADGEWYVIFDKGS